MPTSFSAITPEPLRASELPLPFKPKATANEPAPTPALIEAVESAVMLRAKAALRVELFE